MPRYLAPGRVNGPASLVNVYAFAASRAGTFRNLFARHNSAGGGGTVTYTLEVNGAPTALSVALSAAAIGTASDLVNTVVVAQGAIIALFETITGGSGGTLDVEVSCEFV